MNALLIPGNSPRHAEWVDDLAVHLSPYFNKIITQHYRHWETGDSNADVAYEISRARDLAKDLGPYVVVAKSIGTVIALQAAAAGDIQPENILLLGTPINSIASPEEAKGWMEAITAPITIAQNEQDPFGSFPDVANALRGTRAQLVRLPGDNHDYVNYSAIRNLL